MVSTSSFFKWFSLVARSFFGATDTCKFYPSCSVYASRAYAEHNFLRATGLTVWRLVRCSAFTNGGIDPVPEKNKKPISLERGI